MNGFTFDLAQPDSFHSALGQVLANRRFARELAVEGARKVELEYSVGVIAGRLKGLYDQLLEEKACVT
jgi:glycosyltransferase involved in cell wall biosynthesis